MVGLWGGGAGWLENIVHIEILLQPLSPVMWKASSFG